MARELDVALAYVQKLVKKGEELGDPFPLDDVGRGRAWMERHTERGIGIQTHRKGEQNKNARKAAAAGKSPSLESSIISAINNKTSLAGSPPITSPQNDRGPKPEPVGPVAVLDHNGLEVNVGIGTHSLEQLLANAWEVQKTTYEALEEYKKRRGELGQINVLTRAYNESSERFESLQKSVQALKTQREQLVSVDDMKMQINRMIIPCVMLLRKLPQKLVQKLIPGDDGTHVAVAAEMIEDLITELHKGLTMDPRFHLDCFIAGSMMQDESGFTALGQMAAAYKEIEELISKPEEQDDNAM